MLEGDAVLREDGQKPRGEAHLGVQHGLLDGDARKALFARDAGDDALLDGLIRPGHDHGAGILGAVGVADVDGDARLADGEHRVLVEDGRAHVAELPELGIGDVVDDLGGIHHPGVRGQHAGNVRPVLVEVSPHGLGDDGARDVRAAP